MDYSLLIKIEKMKQKYEYADHVHKRNVFMAKDRTELYHLGTIDFLQTFDYFKKFEFYFRTWNRKPEKAATFSC